MALYKLRIDVSKLDKQRLFKGEKGVYANLIAHMHDEEDQYGSIGFMAEEVTKEEREAGKKGTIVGNIFLIKKQEAKLSQEEQDDLPF